MTEEPTQLHSRITNDSQVLHGTVVINGVLHCTQEMRNELLDVEVPTITKGGMTYSPWASIHELFKEHFPYVVIHTEYTPTEWGTKIAFSFSDGKHFSEEYVHPCIRYKHPSYNHVDAPNWKDLTTAAQRGRVKAIALWCGLGMSAFLNDTSDIDEKIESPKDDIELPPVGNSKPPVKPYKANNIELDASPSVSADFFEELNLD